MELIDMVRKLIGPIDPVGETHTDGERFENLKVHCDLVGELMRDIYKTRDYRDKVEYSMKRAGEFAQKELEGFAYFLD